MIIERYFRRSIPFASVGKTLHGLSVSALMTPLILLALTAIHAMADEPQPDTKPDAPLTAQVTIRLVRQADVPVRDAGVLAKLSVSEGASVKAGDILAVLENEQQQLGLKAAMLNLQMATMASENGHAVETAAAQLAHAESARRVSEVALKIAKIEADSDVDKRIADAETQLRQLELERAENARRSFKGSVSESQIDRLRTSLEQGKLEIAKAMDDARTKRLKPEAEQASIDQKNDEIRRYDALLKQEKHRLVVAKVSENLQINEVALAELKLEHRNVRAPFNGSVVELKAQVGEWVPIGAPVFRMIDLGTLRAEGFLPLKATATPLVGRSVAIEVMTGAGTKRVTGKVAFVSSEVDPVNQQVRFWADFENPDQIVLPGLKGTLTIE